MLWPALAVALGYYLAARLGFPFTLQPHPISTLWPPNALLMAALLLAPARTWWWLLAAALPAHLLAELQSGVPLAMVLGWYASNCSEALIGAALVRAFVPGPLRLDSLRNAGIFLLCGGLAAPLGSSFLDAGPGAADRLRRGRLLDAGAHALLVQRARRADRRAADPDLGHVRRRSELRDAPPRRYAEIAAVFAGVLATSLVVVRPAAVRRQRRAGAVLRAAAVPAVGGGAARAPRGTASALALMVVVTIWGAVNGLGPFAGGAPQDTARDMQLFLIAVSVPLLLLAVALEERGKRRSATRTSSACSSPTFPAWRCSASSPAASPTS